VIVTGHYCVVRVADGRIDVSDNNTVYPLALARYSGRRKHVRAAWRIEGTR